MPARARVQSRQRQGVFAERALGMRRAPTPSEARLWEELRGSRLGVAFRRQAVVGEFIVDFLAPRVRLVVEVDGGYHADRERADARRDRVFGRTGYRVVRVTAELVLTRTAEAVGVIRKAVAEAGPAPLGAGAAQAR